MNNKGFTLAELIGVVIILLFIGLFAFPPVLNQIKKSEATINNFEKELVLSAVTTYIKEDENKYPFTNNSEYTIILNELEKKGLLDVAVNKKLKDKNLNKVIVKISDKSVKFESFSG